MTIKFYDRVQMTVAGTPGTGTVTLGAATSAFQTFAAAGASNGDTFPYLIVDGTNWEFGVGTYSTTGPSFARTTINASSNSGSAVNFTSNAIAMCTIRAEDLGGGGGGSLAGLSDVSVSSPSNNQVLTYNSSASKWENESLSGGSLASLSDVSVSSPVAGQSLVYNGGASKWENVVPNEWKVLTFTNSGTYCGRTMYVSNETFTLANGNILEAEGYLHKQSSANCTIAVSEDASNFIEFDVGNDGNQYYGHYASGSFGGGVSTGPVSLQNWTGTHDIKARVALTGSSSSQTIWAKIDGNITLGMCADTSVNLIGTVNIYVATDDITQCGVRARVITGAVFTS